MPNMQGDGGSSTISGDVLVTKVNKRLGLVFGYAIVCEIDGVPYYDTQGDYIPEHAMLKAATEYMLSDREAKEMHVGGHKGTIVFAFPMMSDVMSAMGIVARKTGLVIGMKPDSAEMLDKFETGEYQGFSIGGSRVTDKVVEEGDAYA